MTPQTLTLADPSPASRSIRHALGAAMLATMLAALPTSQAGAFAAPESFAELAQQISPSVVNITTTTVVAANTDGGPMVPPGSPFEDFFREFQIPGDNPGECPQQRCPQRSQAL